MLFWVFSKTRFYTRAEINHHHM